MLPIPVMQLLILIAIGVLGVSFQQSPSQWSSNHKVVKDMHNIDQVKTMTASKMRQSKIVY